jgi:hypothetical protein
VWLHRDPTPVIETGDSFDDLPRFTYRLVPAELAAVLADLAEAGLPSTTLVPRRLRASSGSDTSLRLNTPHASRHNRDQLSKRHHARLHSSATPSPPHPHRNPCICHNG